MVKSSLLSPNAKLTQTKLCVSVRACICVCACVCSSVKCSVSLYFRFPLVEGSTMVQCRETCLIQVRSGEKTSSCSGVVVHPGHRFIATHSTLLVPFLDTELLQTLTQTGEIPLTALGNIRVRVTLQRNAAAKTRGHGHQISAHQVTGSEEKDSGDQHESLDASLVLVWKAERFAKTLQRLMPISDGWKLLDQGQCC